MDVQKRHVRLAAAGLAVMTLSAHMAAARAPQVPAAPQAAQGETARCWPGVEANNPDTKARKPPILPQDLAKASGTGKVAVLKACVNASGNVARVLLIRSSGNRDVDAFFERELAAWVFDPVTRDGQPTESVATIAFDLDFDLAPAPQAPAAPQAAAALKENERCWPGIEAQNPDIKGRKPPILPRDLERASVNSPTAVLKLCVNDSGKVARVLTLRSTGNRKVDTFFERELAKWTFKPMTRDGQPAESVATIGISLDN